jgi:dihydrodipicolinate synthase/N-acetylneuraminate lyase
VLMTSGPATTLASTTTLASIQARVRPRAIDGISALLLPYRADGRPDFDAYADCLVRTVAAGLQPSVNMDTGYVHLLTSEERTEVLRVTASTLRGGPFVAGAFIEGRASLDERSGKDRVDGLVSLYCAEAELIRAGGGTPILFQCSALKQLSPAEIVAVYRGVAERVGPILGFELGEMFAPFGQIYPLELFAELLQIPGLIGVKHSSLDRHLEWQRLDLRDRVRPEFKVYTGNDLAIEMVVYGSDYLLGLSSFAPDAFGLRDRLWAAGDVHFYTLNDVLQFLGAFAFRAPVPAYKHSAAQFLHVRGQIPTSASHPASPTRPDSDVPILAGIADHLDAAMSEGRAALGE